MKIVMFGAGGVGGYFGGRLAQAGCDVAFVARGAHLEALRRDGLRLTSPKGDAHVATVRASDDPRELGPADVVFFTVKLYDAERSAAQLAPLIGPGHDGGHAAERRRRRRTSWPGRSAASTPPAAWPTWPR